MKNPIELSVKMLRTSRLFRKYFGAFMALLLASIVFMGTVLLVFSMRYWSRDKLSLLSINAKRTAQLITEIYDQSSGQQLNAARRIMVRSLLTTSAETLDADFFICNTEGQVVACKEDVPSTALPTHVLCEYHSRLRFPRVTVAFNLNTSFTKIGDPGGIFHQQMLLAFEPFQFGGEPAGFVVAAQPQNSGLFSYVSGILRLFFLAGLLVLALAFVVMYYISYRMVRPVQAMVTATKRYAKGDFGYRVVSYDNDEFGQLAESFNSMAISLATLESSRRSFVANVSHELKTPMTTIGGFIDGMRDGTIPPERHPHYLGLVSEEVKRLARLVTGMLNLSKMEAGEFQLNPTTFDINELLFHTVLSFEQLIAKKSIELIGLEDLQPILLRGDRDMLYQVFYNLIDNAVKFTPPGERLEFYVQIHRQKGAEAERIFCFGLRNTGIGIASEELARIFERFYKADKSRSYDVKGAGLGLYLAKTIVEMHGGQLKADSDGATYTEFAVLLPIESEPEG
jgi:signal transduction histidine kinase